jgi:hypothetical protein
MGGWVWACVFCGSVHLTNLSADLDHDGVLNESEALAGLKMMLPRDSPELLSRSLAVRVGHWLVGAGCLWAEARV